MISADDLHYFIELTSTLNFSRASERIGISQPSLSMAIKRVEAAVGVPLFIRIKKGVLLTPAGKELLSHAKQLSQLWDQVKIDAIESHQEVQGSVSIGCHVSLASYALPKILSELLCRFPKLTVKLKHDISRKILSEVVNLTIDMGIIINPVRHPDLILQKLYSDKMAFWMSSEVKSPNQQLSNDQLVIICDEELAQTEWLLKQLHKTNIKHYRIVTSSSFDLTAKLTASGAGVGIMPESIAMMTMAKKVKMIPGMPSYKDEAYLAYRAENRNIKSIQAVVDAIKAHFKSI